MFRQKDIRLIQKLKVSTTKQKLNGALHCADNDDNYKMFLLDSLSSASSISQMTSMKSNDSHFQNGKYTKKTKNFHYDQILI